MEHLSCQETMQSVSKAESRGFPWINNLSEKGFVLVATVLATTVLLAVGILALTVTSQDIRISSRTVGDRKAFSACESGIHRLIVNFDPANLAGMAAANVQVDATNDPASQYTITAPVQPVTGPGMLPLPGYCIGGGQVWGQTRYNSSVTGTSTSYGSLVQVDVGLGYGPIEITTGYR